jgi:hypothetical protein
MIHGKLLALLGCSMALGIAAVGCAVNDKGGHEGTMSSGGASGASASNGGGAGGATGAGGDVGSGGVSARGGNAGSGGEQSTGGSHGTGGGQGPGSGPGTGGSQNADGDAGVTSGGACSSTAPVGRETGMLIPDVQLQQCDGTWVSLHDLVCGKSLTQVYSYAGWCPGCQGFSGLADGGFMTGNSLYDSYHDRGFEQVIILSATSKFGQTPAAADCAELQALHEGLVVFDATGRKTQDDLGLRINGGTGLVDGEGLWVVPPPVDPPQDAGLVAVLTELVRRFGRF